MRFLVAIPVYNEGKSLIKVLRQVRHYARDILVVDDEEPVRGVAQRVLERARAAGL